MCADVQQIGEIISMKSSKIAICENLDPRKFSAVQYVKSFFRSLILCPSCEERPCCVPHCLLLPVITETGEGRPPIKVKFEIPYFTTSGIQVGWCV